MTTSDDVLLAVEHLEVRLPGEQGHVTVLDDVSFTVKRGEMVGLAGESGSGKTMTALAIMGLLPTRKPEVSGQIVFDDIDLLGISKRDRQRIRGSEISMVFQDPMTSLHPAYTVGEQIAEVVRAHEEVTRRVARERAVEMLDVVGIPGAAERAGSYPHEFSGGMQQRVMIAMALVCSPKLLIADEPTTALDVTMQDQMVRLLQELQGEYGMAVLFVTHDLGLLGQLCDRMMVMYAGQLVEDSATADIVRRPLHPYTAALLQAAPHPDQRGSRLVTIPGSPPRAGHHGSGCRFAPRCEFAVESCAAQVPALEDVGVGRVRCWRHIELDLKAFDLGATT